MIVHSNLTEVLAYTIVHLVSAFHREDMHFIALYTCKQLSDNNSNRDTQVARSWHRVKPTDWAAHQVLTFVIL